MTYGGFKFKTVTWFARSAPRSARNGSAIRLPLRSRFTPEGEAAGDRLTIKGFPITNILVSGRRSPVIPTTTLLVIGITYSVDEAGRLRMSSLRLLGSRRTRFAGTRHDGGVLATQSAGEPGETRRLDIPRLTGPFAIDELGEYEFSLHVGYELVATVPFTVVQRRTDRVGGSAPQTQERAWDAPALSAVSNEVPQAQLLAALGLVMLKPCFMMSST